jgi:hypothetical protein
MPLDFSVSADADASAGRDNALLDLVGKLHIGINSLSKQLERFLTEQMRLNQQPRNVPLEILSQPGAATFDIKDFGGPQPGREWVVRNLSAVASPLAANAALVTWYVGQVMPGPGNGMLPPTMARWQFASVPAFQAFGGNTITIRNGQHLIAGLTGVPASSSIALVATINDQSAFGAAAVYSLLD